MTVTRPVALVIMDGFGLAPAGPENAITLARTPNLERLFAECPWTSLEASGLAVGLPEGQMGNSEVGHLNMGAGRVVYQELTRICKAIEDGTIPENPVLCDAIDAAVASGKAIHLMGLVSDGGVHSHQDHLYALVHMAAARGATDVRIHAFLDGRDVPPMSVQASLKAECCCRDGVGRIATSWAATTEDRTSAGRVEKAWRAIASRMQGRASARGRRESYDSGVTDEFVLPCVGLGRWVAVSGVSTVTASLLHHPAYRAREITRPFVDPDFRGFARAVCPKVDFVCLTEYDPTIPAAVAFPKDLPCCVLADVLAENGLRQLHIAETEKYAHVTFFFNGGAEPPKQGEERVLVPSPTVPTYDLQPEMSEPEVARLLVEAITQHRADFYVVNYANCDMVGHTGVLEAAVRAVEAVDTGVGAVVDAMLAQGGAVLVTADHGNAEHMAEEDGSPFTAHTTDKVPLILAGVPEARLQDGGILADIAPTVLALMGIVAPGEWTGSSLLAG